MTYGVARPEVRRKLAERTRARADALFEQLLIWELVSVRMKIIALDYEKLKLERRLEQLRGSGT